MKPSEETIEKFKKIYQDEFGETISDSQAYEKFLRLVNLLRVVLKAQSSIDRSDIFSPDLLVKHFINDKMKE